MDKIVGYWWEGDKYEIPIIKKEDKYYRYYPKTEDSDEVEEEFPKKMFQYAMTNPWDEMKFYSEEKDGQFVANYMSPVYDWVNCKICGFGKTSNLAMLDLIENILDVMNGYDEEKVNQFMDSCEQK